MGPWDHMGRWGHEAMGSEGHGELSEWAASGHALPLKLSLGPMVQGWGHGTMEAGPWAAGPMKSGWSGRRGRGADRALGRWGHEAMGPEGHAVALEPKTQLSVYGRRLGSWDHGGRALGRWGHEAIRAMGSRSRWGRRIMSFW